MENFWVFKMKLKVSSFFVVVGSKCNSMQKPHQRNALFQEFCLMKDHSFVIACLLFFTLLKLK